MSKHKDQGNPSGTWMMKKKVKEIVSGESSCCITDEILQDMERYPPKSLFTCMFDDPTASPILTRTDVHRGLFHQVVPLDYPDHIRGSHGYSVAVLGSKIYYMGGQALSTTDRSLCINIFNTVSVLDLQKPWSWETAAPMKQPRIHSIVFTYKNNIYVFGSSANRASLWSPYTELTRESYAEYYDPDSDQWSYLPAPIPEEMDRPSRALLSYALNQEAGLVYIWVSHIGVYIYDLEAKTWDKWRPFKDCKDPPPIPNVPRLSVDPNVFRATGPYWSTEVVILHNFLIWHYFGTIYAFRFSDARLFTPFTFPNSVQIFGDPRASQGRPSSRSYLLNVGNGKLCLVHEGLQISEEIKCHVFSVRYSGNPPDDVQIELQCEKSQGLGVACHSILAVLTV